VSTSVAFAGIDQPWAKSLVRQILEKKYEINHPVHMIFGKVYVIFEKANDSVILSKVYEILINFRIAK
jgi:hypothetical protein